MGHVVRCLALAHMLHDYFDISFVLQETDNTIYKWIEDNGFSFKTIIRSNDEETAVAQLLEVLAQSTNRESIVVLDGYHIQTLHQQLLKKEGYRVVAIDDLHSWPHVADAILNHAPGIASAAYQAAHSTRLLLGADYALLRPSLLEASKRERKIQSPKHFLISMGAADEHNYTLFFARLVRKQFPSVKLNLLTSTHNGLPRPSISAHKYFHRTTHRASNPNGCCYLSCEHYFSGSLRRRLHTHHGLHSSQSERDISRLTKIRCRVFA
jgi:spore coat polysaccharide biosynthesis predicted glycosyltransferase SpsG